MLDVIVFANQKGGAGKTTLAAHLSVEAAKAGRRVALVDTDSQGSLSAWWNASKRDNPAFVRATLGNLQRDLRAVEKSGFDLVIVDTRGAIADDIVEAVKVATLTVIPTRPSPLDLRAVGRTIDIIKSERKPFAFVVNAALPQLNARSTIQTLISLSKHGPVLEPVVHQLGVFSESMTNGETAGEYSPKHKAADEVAQLWASVSEQLAQLRKPASAAKAS